MSVAQFQSALAETVDRRRLEISAVKRVATAFENGTLQSTAYLMAVPMLYAHWEGFVKEAVQMYIEYIENLSLSPGDAHPTVFSFMLRKKVQGLIAQQSVERMADFATWVIANATSPLSFSDKNIETRSNLSFDALKDICDSVRVDVSRIKSEKKKIDALVHRRNNAAHTGRAQQVDREKIEGDAVLVMSLITTFEAILNESVVQESFRREANQNVG
ncbi:hypothetical protein LNAOJCKE_1046 [Methylorubrum aminovorans]|uniref:MAE-28990/MAE-18760-like HEPN domain-containing protein n=1 Tax=Methylorubrum aminovorans TaxID=269069 RepID=A0ABQ4UBN0_9HYPH|nr:MAE_28990/MAE_18760 family HEPN-like nuclease [Methylorubrum aminovorans]GJE63848.1 hypothetical protein LNAOJCKE_1046 [Methylorubrum aminovorans]